MAKLFRGCLVLFLGMILVSGLYWILKTPGLKPVVISVYEPPIIAPDEGIHDLGNMFTDSQIQHTFYLYNVGGKPLTIDRVETSCGCTVAKIGNRKLFPGGVTALAITLDTSIKLGKIKKKITIYSNDPRQPTLDLYLIGTVLPKMKGHERLTVKDPFVLFKGNCATCHVLQGKGKTGRALFQADCGMCHGMNGQGAVAPSLLTQDYSQPTHQKTMKRIIQEGTPHNPEMPPFSQAKGGPLSDSEIDSLVLFLTFQSEQAKQGLLDKDGNPIHTEEE